MNLPSLCMLASICISCVTIKPIDKLMEQRAIKNFFDKRKANEISNYEVDRMEAKNHMVAIWLKA